MGFGTLFFGYFLLLNITYFTFTDLIAALVMAMGLYKLSSVNRQFLAAFYSSIAFALIGFFELAVQIYTMFTAISPVNLLSYTSVARSIFISILTIFILLGIENVAYEVGLSYLAKKAKMSTPLVLIVYLALAILDFPIISTVLVPKILAVISTVVLLISFILITINLVTIYTAYAKICMPEDKDNNTPNIPSRFSFVNKYREHTAMRQKEYAEYKLNKLKEKNKKGKKK